jgi:hypothetical protein
LWTSSSRRSSCLTLERATTTRSGAHHPLVVLVQQWYCMRSRLEFGRFLDLHRQEYLVARKVIEDDERRERVADATAWMRTQSHKSGKSPRSSTAARHSASEATNSGTRTRSTQEALSTAWDPASVLQLCLAIDKDRGLSGRRGVHSHDRMLGCFRSAAAIKASTRNAGTLPL